MQVRIIVCLMVCFTSLTPVFCQNELAPTQEEWSQLIHCLSAEKYSDANKLVEPMLEKCIKAEVEGEPDILRYIHIISVAALMNAGELTKQEAIQKVKQHEGEYIITASRQVLTKNCRFNCIKMDREMENTIFITSANRNATEIFGFEYYAIANGITADYLEQNEGRTAIIGGVLESITVEGLILPRFRMNVIGATLLFE